MHSGVDPTYMYNIHVKQPKSSDLFNIEHVCRYSFKQEAHRPPRSTENQFLAITITTLNKSMKMQLCKYAKKKIKISLSLLNIQEWILEYSPAKDALCQFWLKLAK